MYQCPEQTLFSSLKYSLKFRSTRLCIYTTMGWIPEGSHGGNTTWVSTPEQHCYCASISQQVELKKPPGSGSERLLKDSFLYGLNLYRYQYLSESRAPTVRLHSSPQEEEVSSSLCISLWAESECFICIYMRLQSRLEICPWFTLTRPGVSWVELLSAPPHHPVWLK